MKVISVFTGAAVLFVLNPWTEQSWPQAESMSGKGGTIPLLWAVHHPHIPNPVTTVTVAKIVKQIAIYSSSQDIRIAPNSSFCI